MDKMEKLNALLNSEAFEQEMAMVNSLEEMQALFARNGVELTSEEIVALCKQINVLACEGELGEDDLEDVSGGAIGIRSVRPSPTMIWLIKKLRDKLFGRNSGKR